MTPLEVTIDFLQGFCCDAGTLDEVRDDVANLASHHPQTIQRYLSGIERLLADPPTDNTLADIVAWDANWILENPSNEGAKQWLQEMIQLLREVLKEVSNFQE